MPSSADPHPEELRRPSPALRLEGRETLLQWQTGMAPLRRALPPEVGAALFEKGLRPLLRLLAVIVERQRFEAERTDALDVLAVGVERALGDGDCRRRQ